MNKTQTISRAKSYLDMLAVGVDPISGAEVPEDSVLAQERLRTCFAFVAEVLGEVLENHGLVMFPDEEQPEGWEIIRRKEAFSFSAVEMEAVKLSDKPLSPQAFVNRINAGVDAAIMEKYSVTGFNEWLVKRGFFEQAKVPTVVNRTQYTPTEQALAQGFAVEQVLDKATGELKPRLMLSREAQTYVLAELLRENAETGRTASE